MENENPRNSAYPVSKIFLERWSPRSFVPQAMPDEDLMAILEAGRHAPSAMNTQPWRIMYAHRGTPEWEKMAPVLFDTNYAWAQNASVMLLLFSDTLRDAPDGGEAKPFRSHAFDAGAAWAYIALQAQMLGYHAHAMGGVHHDKAMEIFDVPKRYRLEVAIAIGTRGEKSALPEPFQPREAPSPRKPLEEILKMGAFPA